MEAFIVSLLALVSSWSYYNHYSDLHVRELTVKESSYTRLKSPERGKNN